MPRVTTRFAAKSFGCEGSSEVCGDVERSPAHYQAALNAFDRVGAAGEISAIHSVIAQRLEAIGDYRSAWEHRQQALLGVSSSRDPQTILLSTAMLAKRQELLPAALAYQNEALAASKRLDSPVDLVGVVLNRADVLFLLGLGADAGPDIDEAARQSARITDPGLAKRFGAETDLAMGEIAAVHDPVIAPEALGRKVGNDRPVPVWSSALPAHIKRWAAPIRTRAGPPTRRPASRKASTCSNDSALCCLSGAPRLGYFDLPWNLFDDMIALLSAESRDAARALMVAERSRARDLAETAPALGRSALIDPASMAAQLPSDTAVVYQVALRNELLSWVMQRHGVRLFRKSVEGPRLEAEISAFRSAIERRVAAGPPPGENPVR